MNRTEQTHNVSDLRRWRYTNAAIQLIIFFGVLMALYAIFGYDPEEEAWKGALVAALTFGLGIFFGSRDAFRKLGIPR